MNIQIALLFQFSQKGEFFGRIVENLPSIVDNWLLEWALGATRHAGPLYEKIIYR